MSTAGALHVLGKLAARAGEAGTARALLGESLALHRRLGNQRGVARVLTSLGDLAWEETDMSSASRSYAEALRVAEATGDRFDIAACLAGIARLTSSRQPALAVRLVGSALAVWDEVGAKPYPDDAAALDRTLSDLRTRLAVPVFDHAWQVGQVLSREEAIGVALAAVDAAGRRDEQPDPASRTVVPLRARQRAAADRLAPKPQQQAGR
jgi:hypothetical protein